MHWPAAAYIDTWYILTDNDIWVTDLLPSFKQ